MFIERCGSTNALISRRNGRRTFKERKTRTESVKNSKLRSAVSFGLIILLHEPKTRYGKTNPQNREQTPGADKHPVRENKPGKNKRPIFTPPFIPEQTESGKKTVGREIHACRFIRRSITTDDRRSGVNFMTRSPVRGINCRVKKQLRVSTD